ncbi:uncharacterized protein METZ01_LOCUS503631, partial [marine metagenome]
PNRTPPVLRGLSLTHRCLRQRRHPDGDRRPSVPDLLLRRRGRRLAARRRQRRGVRQVALEEGWGPRRPLRHPRSPRWFPFRVPRPAGTRPRAALHRLERRLRQVDFRAHCGWHLALLRRQTGRGDRGRRTPAGGSFAESLQGAPSSASRGIRGEGCSLHCERTPLRARQAPIGLLLPKV